MKTMEEASNNSLGTLQKITSAESLPHALQDYSCALVNIPKLKNELKDCQIISLTDTQNDARLLQSAGDVSFWTKLAPGLSLPQGRAHPHPTLPSDH